MSDLVDLEGVLYQEQINPHSVGEKFCYTLVLIFIGSNVYIRERKRAVKMKPFTVILKTFLYKRCPLSSGPSGPRPRCHPSGGNTAAGACQRPD